MDTRRVLLVVMDGIGVRENPFGNSVHYAWTPAMDWLKNKSLYTTLKAHGEAVGLPSDKDMGNSEIGHNALGAGRTFDQGAKLVEYAIESNNIYKGNTWKDLVGNVTSNSGTLHFIGLLSDGNVHSHEQQLYRILVHAKEEGIKKVRIHALFDGRDVGSRSAETFVNRLEKVMSDLESDDFDISGASGGGRMRITMDRYEADWAMVEKGWQTHVLGKGQQFPSFSAALEEYRKDPDLTDQYLPEFIISDKKGNPSGPILDGDGVVFFNFRGDRAIEISRAFCEKDFPFFERERMPDIYYAGLMEYDGDAKIPKNYLVSPPQIDNTLSEYLITKNIRQFACSETQKFGHVTYFWNGNRSGYFDKSMEEYLEIPSDDDTHFDRKPWMKAREISKAAIERMLSGSFDFGRINFANGDMVGHTGDLEASVIGVATVDMMLRNIIGAAEKTQTILIVTADHGNCEEMFDVPYDEEIHGKLEDWEYLNSNIKPKTSHSLNPVPFYFYDPMGMDRCRLTECDNLKLSNMAATINVLLGVEPSDIYDKSIIEINKT